MVYFLECHRNMTLKFFSPSCLDIDNPEGRVLASRGLDVDNVVWFIE